MTWLGSAVNAVGAAAGSAVSAAGSAVSAVGSAVRPKDPSPDPQESKQITSAESAELVKASTSNTNSVQDYQRLLDAGTPLSTAATVPRSDRPPGFPVPSNAESPNIEEDVQDPGVDPNANNSSHRREPSTMPVIERGNATHVLKVNMGTLSGVSNKQVFVSFRIAYADKPDFANIDSSLPACKTTTLKENDNSARVWNTAMPDLWVKDPHSQVLVVELYSTPLFKAKKLIGFADFPLSDLTKASGAAVVESDFESFNADTPTFGAIKFTMQLMPL